MATLPFLPPTPANKHREPLTGARRIIVSVAVGFAIFLLWAMLAQGRRSHGRAGQGHSVEQGPADPGGRAGHGVGTAGPFGTASCKRPIAGAARQSGKPIQIQAETDASAGAVGSPSGRGTGRIVSFAGRRGSHAERGPPAGACRAGSSALAICAEQRRREAAEAAATINCLSRSLVLAQRASGIARAARGQEYRPADRACITARREVVDLQGRIAAAREQAGPRQRRCQRGAEPGQ